MRCPNSFLVSTQRGLSKGRISCFLQFSKHVLLLGLSPFTNHPVSFLPGTFQKKKKQKRKAKLDKLQEDFETKQAEEQQLKQQLEDARFGREESEERTRLLEEIACMENKLVQVDVELSRFAEFDPEEMMKLEANVVKARESANRWVDNIFNCQSWVSRTFNMEKRDFDAQFGIPTELDYLEA